MSAMEGSEDRAGNFTVGRVAFEAVDEQPDPARLIAGMDAADNHESVARLRSWAADALTLREGKWVIDVGCGPGTAAVALAGRVGSSGSVRGVDASVIMVAEAQGRTANISNLAFEVGDATDLRFDADSFDAYRSERTYQWLDAPDRALNEALRVLRPGGRIVVIDTDWGTLTLDHPDVEHDFAEL
jgi:ubiquinone/menaquinone biosynthesis C-methylase UbiE